MMDKKNACKLFILFFIVIGISLTGQAQDLLKGRDLSQVKVDQLSDADIVKLQTQLTSAGLTIDQAEQLALSKGMPITEFAKLKQRLALNSANQGGRKLKSPEGPPKTGVRTNNSSDSLTKAKYLEAERVKPLIDPLIFGSELYTSVSPSFEPNLSIATPTNYILGPNDEISVSVYGVQQYEGALVVSPEGYISIPSVGLVRVAGLTIEAATQKLKSVLENGVYPYLKSGGAKLSVTLSKIRTIHVTVIGSNLPGDYTLSSLSTVFNALYIAGGPSAFGSFREIELLRNGKLERKIDIYRFILNGDQSDNIALKDNDVIRIPTYKKRVEIQGQVKRPGIFEVLPGEHFSQILAYASGFTDTAYQARIKIIQRSDRERMITDIDAQQYTTYEPQSGDVFVVSKLLNRYQNRVTITGAVFRPDVFALSPGLRVADLIRKADGLREDAYTGRAQIIRLEEDLTKSIVSFDIRKALNNDLNHNLLLQREDEILITSVQDLRDTFKVTIQGEVRIPGEYDYVNNLTLKDLILQAGGFTDAAYKNIEISRLIKRDSIAATDIRSSEVINTQISGDLSSAIASVPLQPHDVITIRRKPGYQLPESVIISGQVQYPGPYTLNNRGERVSDIFKRSGGALPDANLDGAYIKRYKSENEKDIALNTARKIQKNVLDSSVMIPEDISKDYDQIPLDLPLILSQPGSTEDMVLKTRDEIVIPRYDPQVKVSGGILLPTQIPYQKAFTVPDYIASAGGYAGRAWKNKVFVVYPNGKAAVTRHFLFFKSFPKIVPGSELVIPLKPEKKAVNTAELIAISSGLVSLAGVVIAILKL